MPEPSLEPRVAAIDVRDVLDTLWLAAWLSSRRSAAEEPRGEPESSDITEGAASEGGAPTGATGPGEGPTSLETATAAEASSSESSPTAGGLYGAGRPVHPRRPVDSRSSHSHSCGQCPAERAAHRARLARDSDASAEPRGSRA